jgi:predicted RNase H-like nuclease (RuvC/YqgF family)
MIKELLEAGSHIFGITRDIEACKRDVKRLDDEVSDLRQEVRALTQKVERLAVEVERNHERAETDRKVFLLQLENLMLKMERRLPPASENRQIE